jgi:general secretion pathway protein B
MTAPDIAAPPPAPRVAMAQPVADPVMEMHEPGVLELHELPYDIQQRIPVMQFSAHVYSSNPLQRSVVINGRFMEEGDYLESDLYLSEITTDGAIFDFQGQRFHQRIVSAWN